MRTASLLFAFGLVLRVLFWLAGPNHGAPWDPGFQGDAPVWQELAQCAATGRPNELLLLPLRPPGMHWLVSTLWNGAGSAWLPRVVFVVLGAGIAPLVWSLLRNCVAARTACLAAAVCAGATNLMLLSSGLHSELPYLVLVLVSLFDQERLRTNPSTWVAVRWGALHAVLCLLRAEHAITFAAFLLLLLWQGAPRWRSTALAAGMCFCACLVPWHVHAWRQIDAYNHAGHEPLPTAGMRVPGGLPWTAAALDRLNTLPSFQQVPTYGFVGATVSTRDGTEVKDTDLDILREAYDVWPENIPHPFVCLYGGLNFFLGNSPEADGGFSQRALDRRPPLRGGPSSYPPGLLQVLPHDGTLALSYPPHLDLLVHGYRHGLAEISADPTGALVRAMKKLWYGLQGATGGLGGFALPIGLSGERRAVDLVTAVGIWPAIWRAAVGAVALFGLWTLRRQAWLQAWLVFAATKLAVVFLFFGYARQGALCIPVLAIGFAAAADRHLLSRAFGSVAGRGVRLLLLAGIALLACEVFRCIGTGVSIDGQVLGDAPPGPIDHGSHELHYR